MSNPSTPSAAELLATPVQFIRGVGSQRAERLARLGLHIARDVLFYFPRDYQDLTDVRRIADLEEDQLVSVHGEVEEVEARSTGRGRSMVGVLVRQGDAYLRAIWFNQPFMENRFQQGQQVLLSGKAKLHGMRWEMTHPRVQTIDREVGEQEDGDPEGRLLPVYSLTDGVRQWHLRRAVRSALETCAEGVEEVFPEAFLTDHNLLPIHEALQQIHFPTDHACLQKARYRFIYQELLLLQIGLGLRRNRRAEQASAPALEATAKIDARIRRRFPFELTDGQNNAIGEINADMGGRCPMNRLLQGDVGSGKTVIALYASLLAVAHGYQVAIMAPTEVLARQHARVLGRFLAESRVRTELLSGSLTPSQRGMILAEMANGGIDVVIGTHALVQPGIEFSKLGLVIIDEQHKFGVRQRAELKEAGLQPHYLVMTATPIPRTITMAVFGDLDVTTMRDFPPGRQKIHTYLAGDAERPKWWEFVRKKLHEGRQGYVIVPLIEESDSWNAASLAEAYEELANGPLEEFRLGMLHGRMSGKEKDVVMNDFNEGRIQVLVSTTVVEVGVDVPNATLMAIEGADRFGLAQLHQLRGRIGRGKFPGYCSLFADPANEDAAERLQAFVNTSDGFELSEIDFQLRGPGDLFGTRQHGLPPFRIANLVRDAEIVQSARRDAQQLLAADSGLSASDLALLRDRVLRRYGNVLQLGDVG